MVLTQPPLMAPPAESQLELVQSLLFKEHTVVLKPLQPQLLCLLLATELVRHTAPRATVAPLATSKPATSKPDTSAQV
jgi:hypothetical protein